MGLRAGMTAAPPHMEKAVAGRARRERETAEAAS